MGEQTFDTAFASYRQIEQIGSGGAGRVLRVRDARDGAEYALKILNGGALSKDRSKRFQNELFFCVRRTEPHFVRVLDYGFKTEGDVKLPFYVMPLFDGTLRTALKGADAESRLLLLLQAFEAVEALHLLQAFHRDVKPENFLWSRETGRIVLADFGCAHFHDELQATTIETQPGQRLASFAYSAPEQRSSTNPADQRADIWALGLICNEAFTSTVPHGTGYRKIGATEPSLAFLDDIVDMMLKQDPGDRPVSIGRVKELIGARRTEFVSRQKLDALRQTVVASGDFDDPAAANPVQIVGFDYFPGQLILELNQTPPPDWSGILLTGRWSHSSVLGSGPTDARLDGRRILVRASEQTAATIQSQFREHVATVNRLYLDRLRIQAQIRENEERADLAKRVAAEEERQRVLRSLQA